MVYVQRVLRRCLCPDMFPHPFFSLVLFRFSRSARPPFGCDFVTFFFFFSVCPAAEVCIHDLPRAPGLTNPDTYRDKFEKYGEIVFIAICLKNGKLLKARKSRAKKPPRYLSPP